jgi:NAD(P)H-hydrate epimerase
MKKESRLTMFGITSRATLRKFGQPDLCIDALFGTGFKGIPKGIASGAIRWMNTLKCPVIAVDIPSGVDADTGAVASIAVRCTTTVTMGALKRGLLL